MASYADNIELKGRCRVSDCKHPTVIAGVKCLQCEIERLNKEVKEQKELVQMILAEAYRNGVEIIVHEKLEVSDE